MKEKANPVAHHGTPYTRAEKTSKRPDNRECSDTYSEIVCATDKYRVVVCKDTIQWIIQRRRPAKQPAGRAWNAIGYCATRHALLRLWRKHMGSVPTELAALPDNLIFHAKGVS
ncbi:hypothetical protein ABLN87_04360 [Ruegeria sp. SCPT10]|uniref:hypothetical protein n=1 Tax=Ruegeria sp. SCP10 TaxID=3141377 RepID=UPI00333CCA23